MIQWPPKSKILCHSAEGDLVAESYRGKIDLSDDLMLNHNSSEPKIVNLSLSTKASDWELWDKDNVKKIEQHITYDLGFDGYEVKIKKISRVGPTPCNIPFNWRLEIKEESIERETHEREQNPTRFKVARSDASIKSIQRKIEKIFGLPTGSVKIVKRNGRKEDEKTIIKDFRAGWEYG